MNPPAPPDTSTSPSTGARDRHEPLTTKEGWRRFVNQPPEDITTAITAEATTENAGESDPLDAATTPSEEIEKARLAYHSRLAVVATPTIRQVTLNGRRLIVLNRHQLSARRGLIVTGPAATGKTTAITQLGKAHELALQLRHPHDAPRMPVLV